VFLAGGIGITPFRSIVFRAAKEKLPHRIFLFYSNRRPEDAPFLDELQALERENPNYKLIASMTEMSKSHRPWQGEAGMIDKEMLARHLPARHLNAVSPVYYCLLYTSSQRQISVKFSRQVVPGAHAAGKTYMSLSTLTILWDIIPQAVFVVGASVTQGSLNFVRSGRLI